MTLTEELALAARVQGSLERAYGLERVADVQDFVRPAASGDREALLISAGYPRMEFTFTDTECRLAQRQMEMFVEVGRLRRNAPIESFFVS